jgi:hypothetical protein
MVITYESARPSPPTNARKAAAANAAVPRTESTVRRTGPTLRSTPGIPWRQTQVWADLDTAFEHFDTADIEHLLANRDHLVRNTYNDGQGGRCLFGWLSAKHTDPIDCREALTRYFTGASGYPACEEPVYQAPRWLVRLIDGDICDRVRARYPGITSLPWEVVIECAEEHLEKRLRGR